MQPESDGSMTQRTAHDEQWWQHSSVPKKDQISNGALHLNQRSRTREHQQTESNDNGDHAHQGMTAEHAPSQLQNCGRVGKRSVPVQGGAATGHRCRDGDRNELAPTPWHHLHPPVNYAHGCAKEALAAHEGIWPIKPWKTLLPEI